MGDASSLKNVSFLDQPDQSASSEKSFEQDVMESSNKESLPINKQVACPSSSSPELSTEGKADNLNSTETALKPEEHD